MRQSTKERIDTAHAQGRQRLDERIPGWRTTLRAKLKNRGLNLQHCQSCVLGHLFGGYVTGLKKVLNPSESSQDYGFDLPINDTDVVKEWWEELAYLENLWKGEIRKEQS